MTRQDFVDWFAGVFRIGSLKATASDGQSSTTATVDAGEGGQFAEQETYGLSSVLERPQDGAECVFVDIGDERVVIATKDRRWQIPLAKGEVVVRAMGAASPAYVKLKPDGTAEIHALRIDLGGESLSVLAARADYTDSRIAALVAAMNSHTHPVPGVTAGPASVVASANPTAATAQSSVACTKVRIQ